MRRCARIALLAAVALPAVLRARAAEPRPRGAEPRPRAAVAAPRAAPRRSASVRRRRRPAPRRRRGALRLAGVLAAWTAIGLGGGLAAAIVVPFALQMRPLVVLSGSMEPVLHPGDVTIVQRIDPAEARVGDVVTFAAPETGRLVTHRVRSVHRAGPRFAFTTKGDANDGVERWTLAADGRLSRAVYRVPWIGHLLLRMRTPLGWTLLVGLPLVGLAGQELRRIWRRAPEVTDAAAA